MRRTTAVLVAGVLLVACRSSPPPSPAPTPPAFRVPAPGRVTVLSTAFPGAGADPARSRLAWAAGPVAAGPDGAVLIADTDADDGRVVVVARDGARSRSGGEAGPTVGSAGLAIAADGTVFASQADRVVGYDRSGVRAVTIGGGTAGPPPYPARPGARFGLEAVHLRQPSSLTALGRDGVAFVDHPGRVGTGTAKVWAYQAGELRLLSWVDRGAPHSPGLVTLTGAPFVVAAITAMPDGQLLAASADSPGRLLRIDPAIGAVTRQAAPDALPRANAAGEVDPRGDRLAVSGIASDGHGGWLLAGGFLLFRVDPAGPATLLLRGGRGNPCGAIPPKGLAARATCAPCSAAAAAWRWTPTGGSPTSTTAAASACWRWGCPPEPAARVCRAAAAHRAGPPAAQRPPQAPWPAGGRAVGASDEGHGATRPNANATTAISAAAA